MFSRAVACASIALSALAGAPAARADVLTVTASGTIGSSCSVSSTTGASTGNFATPDLSTSGTRFVTGQAKVNCNTGFKITATSLNGSIKSTAVPPASFTNSVSYNFSVSVPLDDGTTASTTTPATPCPSSGMTTATGCVLTASGKTATGTANAGQIATMTLAYTVPALPTRLIAGTYSDTITLTIATAP